MKKILALILALIIAVTLISCDKDTPTETNTDTSTDTQTQTTDTQTDTDTATDTGTDIPDVPVDNKKDPTAGRIEHSVNVDQAINLGVFDAEDIFGNEGTSKQYSNVTDIDVSHLASGGNSYKISSGGCYRLTGKSNNGQIYVNASGQDVVLILDNLSLIYKGNEPAIFAEKCNSVTIILVNENTVADSSTNLKKGAIYVKSCGLTLDGTGTLNVTGNFKSGIFNTKELVINGGQYNINAKYHGIYGEQKLTINGGKFNITSEKSGLKSGDYDETAPLEAVVGSVVINSGSITIDATTNGISSYGGVEINGGRIAIKASSDGIDATENILINPPILVDAIEETASEETNAQGPVVIIDAKGDGIKTDKEVTIEKNANVKINSEGDGIDATVNVHMSTGGVVYIKTTASYAEDATLGSYVLVNGVYYKVDPADYPEMTMYSVVNSCKGIKTDGKITINGGSIGIDSAEDALKANEIVISGGKVVVSTNEDFADAETSINVLSVKPDIENEMESVQNSTVIDVLNANKGLKAPAVTIDGGRMSIVTISDAIDSPAVTVNGGTLYLFENVDAGEGSFTINGGTVISISTENEPYLPTDGDQRFFFAKIEEKELYVYGNYVQIWGDAMDSIILKLPKKYSPKLSIVVSSEDVVPGSYQIDVGTCEGGKINSLECIGGIFTSLSSHPVELQ
ncbi:MAG: carbohydrate-binding domain-containing protein [Eubacteriales bacterium]